MTPEKVVLRAAIRGATRNLSPASRNAFEQEASFWTREDRAVMVKTGQLPNGFNFRDQILSEDPFIVQRYFEGYAKALRILTVTQVIQSPKKMSGFDLYKEAGKQFGVSDPMFLVYAADLWDSVSRFSKNCNKDPMHVLWLLTLMAANVTDEETVKSVPEQIICLAEFAVSYFRRGEESHGFFLLFTTLEIPRGYYPKGNSNTSPVAF